MRTFLGMWKSFTCHDHGAFIITSPVTFAFTIIAMTILFTFVYTSRASAPFTFATAFASITALSELLWVYSDC
jgi:uncharacterized membrane protein (DUF485 family)